jgi:hypothetical protein
MALDVQIDIAGDVQWLRKLAAEAPQALETARRNWAVRGQNEIRRAARAKGGRRFWVQVADATHTARRGRTGWTVYIAHVAAAHKERGGVIEASPGKALTIPIAPEARGKRATEFPNLQLIKTKKGTALLVAVEPDGTFRGLYVLKKRVWQAAEPYLPAPETFAAWGEEEIDWAWERMVGA